MIPNAPPYSTASISELQFKVVPRFTNHHSSVYAVGGLHQPKNFGAVERLLVELFRCERHHAALRSWPEIAEE